MKTFAADVAQQLEDEQLENRRVARILATLTTHISNMMRLSGKQVPDTVYRTEDDYMPGMKRRREKREPQAWSSVAKTLGFE